MGEIVLQDSGEPLVWTEVEGIEGVFYCSLKRPDGVEFFGLMEAFADGGVTHIDLRVPFGIINSKDLRPESDSQVSRDIVIIANYNRHVLGLKNIPGHKARSKILEGFGKDRPVKMPPVTLAISPRSDYQLMYATFAKAISTETVLLERKTENELVQEFAEQLVKKHLSNWEVGPTQKKN